jgi:chemotaxis signal transduction protein
MSMPRSDVTASSLRHAFDVSFAAPLIAADDDLEDFLMARIGGDRHLIRLAEIAGLLKAEAIVDVLAAAPAFLGVVGVRGALVPVFDLAMVLGYEDRTAQRRWMILCGGEEPIALAFADFEGYRRLAKSALHEEDGVARADRREIARVDDGACPVINIPLIVAATRKSNRPLAGKEQ